ncbi:MAG: hypothetical protein EBR30_22200 [Cytophagia bacterium]|nr:hypothetical protein [Cytophagia bacterium]
MKSNGWEVSFINNSEHKGSLISRLNWLTLWFFDIVAIRKSKASIGDFDLIIINDLRYLPLAKYAYQMNKTVIYDTIDFNVHLRLYQLVHKIPLIIMFKRLLRIGLSKMELYYAYRYTHAVTVNSRALFDYFKGKATILYYSSPFENIEVKNDANLPTALLYLGAFTEEKGAVEVLKIQKQLKIPLFIFGQASLATTEMLKGKNEIYFTEKLSVERLQIELINLLHNYFLVGFSLIKPAHFSYEVQEANKDIDYLALGVPLVGNRRLPTKEKIEAGCGLFYDDVNLLNKLTDYKWRNDSSKACLKLYNENYSKTLFIRKLNQVLISLKLIEPSED